MEIFITYSRSGQTQVVSLVKDLEELGHNVWFDHDLSGGQRWWDNILTRIRACQIYIFAISQEALDSTACIRELKYAEALQKSPLPVIMNAGISMAMVPRYLSNMQYIDYSNSNDKSSVFALVKAINNLPASPALPDPLPEPPAVPISYLDTLKEKIDTRNLDRRDQISLVRDLKDKLNDPQVRKEDITVLLKKLRNHDDLLASIGKEIDEIINEANSDIRMQASAPASTPQPEQIKSEPIPPSPAQAAPIINQQAKSAANTNAIAKKENKWSPGAMIGLVIATVIIPFVGIIAGIIGVATGVTAGQSVVLIVIGVVMAIIYSLAFS
jgi:hypothetical protein